MVAVIARVRVFVHKRLVTVFVPVALGRQYHKSRQHKRPSGKQPPGDRVAQQSHSQNGTDKRVRTEESPGARDPHPAHCKYEQHQAWP
jgi:hypothetical protein